MESVDAEVLATLNDDILRPAVAKEAIRLALESLSPEAQLRDRERRETELREARQECERLAEAIGQGGPLQALVARLGDRQQHADALERSLAAKAAQAPAINRRQLEQRLRAKLDDWRGLLGRNVTEGRTALRALLVGPLRFTPIRDERRQGYAFEGTIALDRLLSGVIELPTKMASPTPASWNQIVPWLRQIDGLRAA